ncbi:uncharacterized protein FN964_010292 isoform 4-T6 [Alca torda]
MTLPRKQEAAIVIPSCLHEEKMGECDQVSEVFVSFVSADSSPLFSITTFSTSATCMHTHTHVMQILNCAINSMNEKSLVCNVMKVWQCHYTSRNAFILKSSFNGTNGAKVVHKSGQNLLSAVNFTEAHLKVHKNLTQKRTRQGPERKTKALWSPQRGLPLWQAFSHYLLL